jgi:hypothetical protein
VLAGMAKRDAADFEVAVDPGRLDGASGGTISGSLAVRLGNTWFPERTWSDFPVIVLGWWLRECPGLAFGGNARFRFMDGPFQFNANAVGDGRVELESEDQRGDLPIRLVHATVPVSHVTTLVFRAAAQVLDACARHNWSNQDTEELRVLVEGAADQPTIRPVGRGPV